MGEKDTGKLYIKAVDNDDVILVSGAIIDMDMHALFVDDEPIIDISALREPIEFECNMDISPAAKVFLLTGKWPSNNWFKMHGGVLQRKAYKRKGRYKHG